MIYSWQTVNRGNLAELVCRPTDYVNLGDEVLALDQNCLTPDNQGPLIFGGSGLLYPEIAPILERAVRSKTYPVIAWGIGHNTHYGTSVDYPDWLDLFDMVGLRDFRTRWEYVPCPSCLNDVFDLDYGPPENELVIYDQVDYPVGARYGGVPRENNLKPASALGCVVKFLASGKTILTSSYHGAYWGMLLNRRVVLWKPWSTKFRTFKSIPPSVDKEVWPLPDGETGGGSFLEDCRIRNIDFAERVIRFLNRTCNPNSAGVKKSL